MPNCAPTKKQVTNTIISIFMNARPVTSMFALCVRMSAIMDMNWFILVIKALTVIVEQEEVEVYHARHWLKEHQQQMPTLKTKNQLHPVHVHYCPTKVSTLESGINVSLCLLIFWLFSRGYGLIPDSIEPIWVV